MEAVKPKKSDKYIPYYFVAFFVFLALADGTFVYLATSTHTGVVKEQAYEKGLNYNQTVAAKTAQDALGWQSDFTIKEGIITTHLQDREGTPIVGAAVSVHFHRPTQAGTDFTVTLSPNADGQYTGRVDNAYQGQWDVTLIAHKNEDSYQNRKRIVVE